MKIHSGVDAGTGYVHTITATAANTHDIVETHRLVREDDHIVYADSKISRICIYCIGATSSFSCSFCFHPVGVVNMNYFAELTKFLSVEDGTYTMEGKKISHDTGFQVTFHQIGVHYSADEYNAMVKELSSVTMATPEVGRFSGFEPHVSFCCADRNLTVKICKRYGQLAYWDWEKMESVYVH